MATFQVMGTRASEEYWFIYYCYYVSVNRVEHLNGNFGGALQSSNIYFSLMVSVHGGKGL